jgi:predicted ABC-type ATPase
MDESNTPIVVVISGPNGAGKTTAANTVLRGPLRVDEFVNADWIAKGLSSFAPENVAISAGRIMLARLHELADSRRSFAFETTLASRSFAPWLAGLIRSGYDFHLVHFWLPSANMAVARVADRVRLGGHHVPEETIRRRYLAGIKNFSELYCPLAASWQLINNAIDGPSQIAYGSIDGDVTIERPTDWATFLSIQS